MTPWRVAAVDEVSSKVGIGPFGSSIKVETFVPTGVPVISGQHLRGIRLEDRDFNFVTVEHASRFMNANVYRGDVILTHAGNVGQVAYIPADSKFDRYICSQRQYYIRCRPDVMDPRFLAYYLHGPSGRHDLLANASQVGVPSIAQPVSNARRLMVPVPPLEEQRAIADVLGALDDKIESNRRVAGMLHAVGRATFASYRGDTRTLADVSAITMGSSPPGETYNEERNGLPFYQGTKDFGFRYPTSRVWCTAPVRAAQDGDSLISVRAPVGRLNRAYGVCCIGRGVAAASSQFASTLFYALDAAGDVWDPYQSEGTVFGSVGRADLEGVRIMWPADPDHAELVLRPLEARLLAAEVESRTLAALRDALLPELLSGRLRVPEARERVEAVT